MAELLAWLCGVAGDAQGREWGSGVVYERSQARARIRWARAEGHAPEHVTAEREPALDAYAPGPPPATALLAADWWMECAGCHGELIAESEPEPLCEGAQAWCGEACRTDCLRSPAVAAHA